MKTFFIQNKDDIKIIISFALMLNGLLIITFYFYNKIAYKKLLISMKRKSDHYLLQQ